MEWPFWRFSPARWDWPLSNDSLTRSRCKWISTRCGCSNFKYSLCRIRGIHRQANSSRSIVTTLSIDRLHCHYRDSSMVTRGWSSLRDLAVTPRVTVSIMIIEQICMLSLSADGFRKFQDSPNWMVTERCVEFVGNRGRRVFRFSADYANCTCVSALHTRVIESVRGHTTLIFNGASRLAKIGNHRDSSGNEKTPRKSWIFRGNWYWENPLQKRPNTSPDCFYFQVWDSSVMKLPIFGNIEYQKNAPAYGSVAMLQRLVGDFQALLCKCMHSWTLTMDSSRP